MPAYTVKQGDCILSIANKFGCSWETLWNHPDNAALKQRRAGAANVLLPGDVVHVPVKTARVETAATDQRHRFVEKISRAQVRLRLLDRKREPRTAVQYVASVDGVTSSGASDGAGYITIPVSPAARELELTVTEGEKTELYTLPLGAIDPIDSLSGVQQRLTNLGYQCTAELGTKGDATTAALRAFQKEMNLDASGEVDDATRQQLKQMHGG